MTLHPSDWLSSIARAGVIGTLAAAALSSTPSASAQAPGAPASKPGQPPQRGTTPDDKELPKVSVTFPGGTLSDYIRALQESAKPTPVNVVVPVAVGKLGMAPVTLKSVTFQAAMDAISVAVENPDGLRFQISPLGGNLGNPALGEPVWGILADNLGPRNPMQGMTPNQRSSRGMEVFAIRDLIATENKPGLSRDELLSTMDAILKLQDDDKADKARIGFHEDVGVLVVRGDGYQLSAVKSLLDVLRRDVQTKREAVENERQQKMYREEAVREAHADFKSARMQWEQARARADEGRKLLEAGQLTQAQMASLNDRVAYLADHVSRMEQQLAQVESRPLSTFNVNNQGAPNSQLLGLQNTVEQLRRDVMTLRETVRELSEAAPGKK